MQHRTFTLTQCLLILFLVTPVLGNEPPPWRSYEVYQPTITRHAVIDARTHEHKYNHCSTIAWFQDRWFCLWGSHVPVGEHLPGQRMVFSTSRDGRTWTPIERVFSSAEHCENPVLYPEGKGHQWQPNLGVVDGELWVLWNQGGSVHDAKRPDGTTGEDLRGLYFSRLKQSDGKWVNRQLLWDGDILPTVDGKQCYLNTTQNLYRLRCGRVLAPVTLRMIGPPCEEAPENVTGWWGVEKRNAVIYTDDLGETWHLSEGCVTPGFRWIQWEPTVWEQPDGSVMMFARNNTNRSLGQGDPTSGQFLLWSISRDRGETWSPHRYVPLESICSRMHVAPLDGRGVWKPAGEHDDFTGRRYVMVHNDAPGGEYSWADARSNLALFFTRGAGFDFSPGNNFSAHQPRTCYPQMWRRGDTLAVSYTTSEPDSRSIYVALISPLPEPDRHYLFPRMNDVPRPPRPGREADWLAFDGGQHVAMKENVDPGADGYSFAAWIRDRGTGMVLDTRNSRGGFTVMIQSKSLEDGSGERRRCPAVSMQTKPHVFGPDLFLSPQGEWHYVGITADNRSGEAVFYVDGQKETVHFQAPVPRPLKGAVPHLGAKSLPASGVPGLRGDLRFAALYAGPVLGEQHHARLYNQFAEKLGRPRIKNETAPAAKPLFWMDPADETAFERDFVLPENKPRGGSEVITRDGRKTLRIRDRGSVSVDLDENHRDRSDRVSIRFRFRPEQGDGQTLCTVGDFNEPARLVLAGKKVFLTAGDQKIECGEVQPDGWTSVFLETFGTVTRARIGEGPLVEVAHKPESTWAFLGEGYPRYNDFPGTRLLIDIASAQTCVQPPVASR